MPDSFALPVRPVLLSILTSRPDGTTSQAANLLCSYSQVADLTSAAPTQLKAEVGNQLAAALDLDPSRLIYRSYFTVVPLIFAA